MVSVRLYIPHCVDLFGYLEIIYGYLNKWVLPLTAMGSDGEPLSKWREGDFLRGRVAASDHLHQERKSRNS